ncbi:HpcH/HpaI aldolase/citrate lyase family protein [Amycolatopsis regifaucium]|uniref:Aldolase n=1 Tax=Amycolatopsis regifaucium TaxID=546365 RepID=A0A154MF51_9PSEU|nr:CoA ester lyase [Amycolatopsis regifaucium]KZB83158.1 aldolase [Amycolatopsis regifaucium]OKA03190.1 CoA ester lyase [Amycolatopsis regifaucium]SFJ47837.1 citrate lyase subunit beta / citryl-CoA lyase [Amycolatopsis regifaucium]
MTTRAERLVNRVRDAATLLFVPGDRPERFAKAERAEADLVVLDLEDAVAPERKVYAREQVVAWLGEHAHCAVRVNAAGTPWHDEDLAALARFRCVVMVPKADPVSARTAAGELGVLPVLIALIETARGVLDAREIASVPNVHRLALGTFDLAAELGVDPADIDALAPARGALVLASAASGLPGPVDGVTGDLRNSERLAHDVRYARQLGFTGKLCVHPLQVSVAAAALRPSREEIRWAHSVVTTAGDGAVAVEGQLVDKPVLDRARRVLRQEREGLRR